MPELYLVSYPTHLGGSPGSTMGSGRALEHDEGDSMCSSCLGHVLYASTLSSRNMHEQVQSVIQCVLSITLGSDVRHLALTPWLMVCVQCIRLDSFVLFAGGFGVCTLFLFWSAHRCNICSLYIPYEVENFAENYDLKWILPKVNITFA